MAKKKVAGPGGDAGGWSAEDLQKLRWFPVAAYVADRAGALADGVAEWLATFEPTRGGGSWRESVQSDFDLDARLVSAVYAARSRKWPPPRAAAFVLLGLGCPAAIAIEVLYAAQGLGAKVGPKAKRIRDNL